MRKILLATTALVGVALSGAAQAAESPIAVNVGGYVDFRAAQFNEAATNDAIERHSDFENVFQVNIEATGKANNGVEYGAKVGLWNGVDDVTTAGDVKEHDAYVWLSGNFGKVVFGDTTSATTDMFVFAPTVGEGQIDGVYDHFTSTKLFGALVPSYLDDDENGTKINYYTPKVGSADHKVQLGLSYEPNYAEKGEVATISNVGAPDYHDVMGAALQYTGKFGGVSAVVSGVMNMGTDNGNGQTDGYRDFTTYGAGAQVSYAGFTVGGSYVDAGRVATTAAQTKAQDVWTMGVKYEAGKVAVAANVMDGRGYNNDGFGAAATTYGANYVRDLQELGLGATYTWFPGLTTAADVVFFQQKVQNNAIPDNGGSVVMLSQKLAF